MSILEQDGSASKKFIRELSIVWARLFVEDADNQKPILCAIVTDWLRLLEVYDSLQKERDHWKANHDEMVARNALLRNRPDLPIERIRGYEEIMKRITDLESQINSYKEKLNENN